MLTCQNFLFVHQFKFYPLSDNQKISFLNTNLSVLPNIEFTKNLRCMLPQTVLCDGKAYNNADVLARLIGHGNLLKWFFSL